MAKSEASQRSYPRTCVCCREKAIQTAVIDREFEVKHDDAQGELFVRKVPVAKREAVSFRDFLNLGVVTKAACVAGTITAVLGGSAPLI